MSKRSAAIQEQAETPPLAEFGVYVPLRVTVLKRLKQAIMEGALKPGELLSENKLAADFVVSRTPVREALRVLEREGLVTVLPGRKIVVSVPRQRDVDEITEIRLLVETEAVRRIRPQDRHILERLERCLASAETALQNNDLAELEKNNTAFHMALISVLNNERLRTFIDSVHETATRLRRYSLAKRTWAEQMVQEHKRLTALLKKGHTEAAVKLLKQHIGAAAEIAHKMINKSNQ